MSYIFVIFTETHKIPLTEIKSLRIVYAKMAKASRPFRHVLEKGLFICL